MSIIKKVLLGFAALSCLVAVKVQADTQETLKIITVIGTDMIVRLDRNIIIAEVDTTSIGTAGVDKYFLGVVEMALFNNMTGATYHLSVTSEQADPGDEAFFRCVNTTPTSATAGSLWN